MLIRIPWLFTRRRLLVALLLDCILFALLFTGWFQLRFGSWPSFSLPLSWLLQFWLLCSYVLGRYYDQEEQASALALKQPGCTLLTLLVSTAVYLAYLWITAIAAAPTNARAFLLPFLLALALGSGLAQVGRNTLLRQRYSLTNAWVVLGSAGFHQHLQRELLWARQTTRLEPPSFHGELFVVENFNAVILKCQHHGFDAISLCPPTSTVLATTTTPKTAMCCWP